MRTDVWADLGDRPPTPVHHGFTTEEDPTIVQLELFGVRIVGIEPATAKRARDGTQNHGNGLPSTAGP